MIVTGVQLANNLGLPATTAQLDAIATGVSAAVAAFLRWDPSATGVRTDYYDTFGQEALALTVGPLAVVTSVWEDRNGFYGDGATAFATTALLVAGVDYTWQRAQGSRPAVLVRIGRAWPVSSYRAVNRLASELRPCRGCVKVSYTLDSSAALAVANMAGLLEATTLYKTLGFGLGYVTSDSLNGATVSVTVPQRRPGNPITSDGFISTLVAPMLLPFRRILMGG